MILRILGLLLGSYLAIVALFYFVQHKFVFIPDHRDFNNCQPMQYYGAQPVTVEGQQKIRLYLKQSENPQKWMIIFHGNAGTACDRFYFVDGFSQDSLNIVVAEYPGYAGDRTPFEQKNLLNNALAVYDHIQSLNSNKLPIYVFGESLGTGVATFVASQRETAGLILHSAYNSVAEVGKDRFPYLPVRQLARFPFPANLWAKKVQCPVLAFHGTADDVIPIRFAEKQIKNFSNTVDFVKVPGAGHNEILDKAGSEYWQKVKSFLDSQPGG